MQIVTRQTLIGGLVALDRWPESINPNESAVVELADGRVMLNVRSESKASGFGAAGFSPLVS